MIQQVATEVDLAYDAIVDSLYQAFKADYLENCLSGLTETFTLTGAFQEYHYTLYYYDQAGNLVQTIPPLGISPITDPGDLQDVIDHRNNPGSNPAVYPGHTMATKYRYNSLNQVVRQVSPDALTTNFWYDRVGRVVVSQDGRQSSLNLYSYTLYDELGRITEVGEKSNIIAMTQDTALSETGLENWINGGAAASRTDVTRTYYDEAPFSIASFGAGGQRNLRSRVASTTFEAVNDNDDDTYDYATHYTYDATGNVTTLVQEIVQLHNYDQGFKRIDYDFDLVSGKVDAVYYQKDSTDQFTHRYEYDEDNRLIAAKTSLIGTSPEGFLFEQDAAYEYFLHGPLARTELGQRSVQGLDYAYTLQGWIKGLNSSLLDPDYDMGQDGDTGAPSTQRVAKDAYGYTIGYYDGDYTPIGGTSFEAAYSSSGLDADAPDLYNGNIRMIMADNQQLGGPLAYAYRYDQLHRIKQMQAWDNFNTGSFSWNAGGSALSDYKTRYNYDANGNITNLNRNGDQAGANALMDSLSYIYNALTNKLNRVDDKMATDARYDGDVDHRHYYSYDGAGNIYNQNEYINGGYKQTTIAWNHYGKVKEVHRLSGINQKTTFGYGPDQNRVVKALINTSTSDTTYTYYFRDAQGNVMAVYQRHEDTLSWNEQHLYGSSRIGILERCRWWCFGSEKD